MEPYRVDARDVITPDALAVDPALLGAPLATPKRRAAALLVDLALAGLLAQLGGFFIGLLGFFQVFWDANRQGVHDRIAGTAVIREKGLRRRGAPTGGKKPF